MTFPTITQALHGHTQENPFLVADYPYGFTLRCQLRAWLETRPGKGTRFVTQTSNPKRGDVWNKPKASTYARIAAGMYLDEQGHVQWYGLTEYSDVADVATFLVHWPEHAKDVSPWIVAKLVHCRAREKTNASGFSYISINGQKVPLREGEAERDTAELRAWEALATAHEIPIPVTVGEAFGEAFAKRDLPRMRRLVDRLRTRGLPPALPFDYEDIFAFAKDIVPGIERAEWDAFLAEIDAADAAE